MSDNYEAVKTLNYQKLISDGVVVPAPKCDCGVSLRLLSFPVQTSPMTHALWFSNYIKTKTVKVSEDSWRISYWSGRYIGYAWKTDRTELFDPLEKQQTNLFCSTSCRLLLDTHKAVRQEFSNFLESEAFNQAVKPVNNKQPKTAVYQKLENPRKAVQLAPIMLDVIRFYKKYHGVVNHSETIELTTESFKSILRRWVDQKEFDSAWKSLVDDWKPQLANFYTYNTFTRSYYDVLGSYFPHGLPIRSWVWMDAAINKGKFYPKGTFVKEDA